ncbi:MAG: D-tyrosyl-tRNA(Tyr) deacylase [Clostridia bacterium]|nr:D-tyrosyl-tRNA(Tyr) deacylase [Clostridia bacterium]
MTAVITRVSSASVDIGSERVAQMGKGLLILLGVEKGDTKKEAEYLAGKCAGLRIFEDSEGKMNLSAAEVGGELVVVTNFTLCGDCVKGKRPSFDRAERPETAEPMSRYFVECCRSYGFEVQTGRFGADMKVASVNDGPITLVLDTRKMLEGRL